MEYPVVISVKIQSYKNTVGSNYACGKKKDVFQTGSGLAFRENEKGESDYEQQEQQPDQHPPGP